MLELLLVALAGLAAAQVPSSTSSIPTITPTTPPTPDFPVCNPDDFVGLSSPWPFPDLPDQFSFTIEGNLVERNRTVVMTEYYDGYGDRGKLEYVFNDTSGFAIFDYNLGEIFLAPDLRTGDECRVYPIADNPMILNFTFGVTHRNGSVHIGSPRTFLEQLRDDSATRYVGEDMVRGIPTQRWQACFGGENISYLIDYHFAYSSWDYEGQGQNLEASEMIPLQFTLNTARLEDGEIKRIYHIYSVIDFRAGPSSVPDSVFRVPNRLACKGRFPGQPVPPVPQFFSTTTERVYSVNGGNGIRTMRVSVRGTSDANLHIYMCCECSWQIVQCVQIRMTIYAYIILFALLCLSLCLSLSVSLSLSLSLSVSLSLSTSVLLPGVL